MIKSTFNTDEHMVKSAFNVEQYVKNQLLIFMF